MQNSMACRTHSTPRFTGHKLKCHAKIDLCDIMLLCTGNNAMSELLLLFANPKPRKPHLWKLILLCAKLGQPLLVDEDAQRIAGQQ